MQKPLSDSSGFSEFLVGSGDQAFFFCCQQCRLVGIPLVFGAGAGIVNRIVQLTGTQLLPPEFVEKIDDGNTVLI